MSIAFHFFLKLRCNIGQIVQKRYFISLFYFLCLSPSLIFTLFLVYKNEKLNAVSKKFNSIKSDIEEISEKLEFFKSVNKDSKGGDLFEKTFLKSEIESLRLLYNHSSFKSCNRIKKRLEFLTKGGNMLSFYEDRKEKKYNLVETYLTQNRSVEIGYKDLIDILYSIEGIDIGRNVLYYSPQFIIQKFTLRKSEFDNERSFLLNMNLIRRDKEECTI